MDDLVERFVPEDESTPTLTQLNTNIKRVKTNSFQPPLMEDELEFAPDEDRRMFEGADSEEDTEEEEKVEDKQEDDDTEDDVDEEDDDDDVTAPPMEGTYDPTEYEHLVVTPDIKDLFSYIMRYTPQTIVLENRFKPFIPDYIPAVGDIDAFIKVGRGDLLEEPLGLTVLDEPAAVQSDPSVLELQLRAVSKQTSAKAAKVKKIEANEKNAKAVEKWVKDISDLHRSKPPPTLHYQKPMPDIDSLMQEWPAELESLLKTTTLPTAEFSDDLQSYIDLMCSLLDIPVHKSRIQSLHVLFTLYSAFKNSQHFHSQVVNPLASHNIHSKDIGLERIIH